MNIVFSHSTIPSFNLSAEEYLFKKTGKRIFRMAPLHHHFELSGWSENKVVMIFTLATLIVCTIGILAI